MIHELLLALSGYPGTIFTWNKRTGLQVKQKHSVPRRYDCILTLLDYAGLSLDICEPNLNSYKVKTSE